MKVDAATKGIGITSTDRMRTLGWKGGSTAERATRKIMMIDDDDDDDDEKGIIHCNMLRMQFLRL